jgi:EAL domain-containing protein (putative c-di-GMP-specific phosphodiesterase class I)
MLAHHLDLKVIAEGIETPGQHAYLEQSGCEFGQGYLFSPPVDGVALQRLLAAPAAPREAEESAVNVGARPTRSR